MANGWEAVHNLIGAFLLRLCAAVSLYANGETRVKLKIHGEERGIFYLCTADRAYRVA